MTGFPLAWLDPVLDRCRSEILHGHGLRKWTKVGTGGRLDQVTDLDLAIERQLIAASLSAYPTAAILSEETHADPAALASDLCFVIDPIDGTKEMIAGRTDFAISVAVFQLGRPVAGVLDVPHRSQRFTCAVGFGARLNGRPLRLAEAPTLELARIAVSSAQRVEPSLLLSWRRLCAGTLVPVGALTPKVAQVLVGDCHAAIYLPTPGKTAFIWDYAAAALLLAEAGGTLISFDGSSLLRTLPVEHPGGWIAGRSAICHQIRHSLQK